MNSLAGMKWDIKLSSAGLVYLHFGKEILAQLMKTTKDDSMVDVIYAKVYENFVQEIDAIDNGVDQFEGEPRYKQTCLIFLHTKSKTFSFAYNYLGTLL